MSYLKKLVDFTTNRCYEYRRVEHDDNEVHMAKQPSPEPSEHQLDVLRFIIAFVEEHGFQPSMQEMAAHFGVSKNAVFGRIKELSRRGYLILSEGKERAIALKHVKFKARYEPND